MAQHGMWYAIVVVSSNEAVIGAGSGVRRSSRKREEDPGSARKQARDGCASSTSAPGLRSVQTDRT